MRISSKTISLVAGSLFLVGLAAGMNAGCGSSSDNVSVCNQVCDKEVTCLGDAGAQFGITKSECMTQCAQANNTTSCPNASTIAADLQACLKQSDCTAFQACIEAAPDCTSSGTGGSAGTHTGGASGTGAGNAGGHATGGTTGAAGSGGAADCSVCDKASACCTAAGGGAACASYSAATCNSSGAAASYASACQQFLTAAAGSGNAACQ